MFTCSELWVSRRLSVCDDIFLKGDRVTFLVVRILQYRPVPDVCTGISATRNTTSEHIITSKHTRPDGFEILPKNFECFACEASNYFREARQSSPCEVQIPLKKNARVVKDLPGWIPGERCERSACAL